MIRRRRRSDRQVGRTLFSVVERYAKKVYSSGAHLVLTETIELLGIDRAYRAEPEFFAATRKAVHDAQRQN